MDIVYLFIYFEKSWMFLACVSVTMCVVALAIALKNKKNY